MKPYHSNLNKRLIKIPKTYFIDSGKCVRLQSHQEKQTILNTPQAGHLFENLVVAEVVKIRDHFGKNWDLSFWRTKEKEEIDLILESDKVMTLLQIKLGSVKSGVLSAPSALVEKNKKIRLQDFCSYLLEE